MTSTEKAQQELEQIERQVAELAARPTPTKRPAARSTNCRTASRPCASEMNAPSHAWQKTELARHPQRPQSLDYIERIFTDFSEIHGDRGFGDDAAIICGMARFHGDEVLIVATQKGRDMKQRVYRNFGTPHPEGYRKAMRVMQIAEKFRRPIFSSDRYRRRLSRHSRRRARTGRSHRSQPARDGAPGSSRSSRPSSA